MKEWHYPANKTQTCILHRYGFKKNVDELLKLVMVTALLIFLTMQSSMKFLYALCTFMYHRSLVRWHNNQWITLYITWKDFTSQYKLNRLLQRNLLKSKAEKHEIRKCMHECTQLFSPMLRMLYIFALSYFVRCWKTSYHIQNHVNHNEHGGSVL